MPKLSRHFYFAQKINNIIKNNKSSKFLEIGGGCGGLAKLLFGRIKITFINDCGKLYYTILFLKKIWFKSKLSNQIQR